MTKRISVVVPMYNVKQYVQPCVDSILAQAFQDFEIILVDDASTDGGADLCRKLYDNNKKIRLVRHDENLGLGAVLNTGMQHASGKYVCFVAGDDFILQDTLETLYDTAERSRADAVQAAGWYEVNQSGDNPRLRQEDYIKEGLLKNDLLYKLEEHWKKGATSSQIKTLFCRREVLEKNQITFQNNVAAAELFRLALFCRAERYYILSAAAYVKRNRDKTPDALNQFAEGTRAIIEGTAYIEKFLDDVPRFDEYDAWREHFLATFINKMLRRHTVPVYKNFVSDVAWNEKVDATLEPFFPKATSFVKYFFSGFHLLSQRVKALSERELPAPSEPSKSETLSTEIFDYLQLSDRKIVFVNFMGRGFGCNPKYIALEIIRQNLPYDLVWLVNDLNEPMPAQIRKVVYGSVDSIYELATAKVIVSNVKNLLPYPDKKQGQFFIMTWHGGPDGFKLIEKEAEHQLNPAYVRESKINSSITDLMMASNQYGYEIMRNSFWYDGEILTCGLPRNDILFHRDENLIAQVRQSLNVPPENKIVMYAPTFRNDVAVTAEVCRLDAKKLLAALKKRFGGDWTLLIRHHPNVANAFAGSSFGDNVINSTAYPDVQELILVADVLISDYSSVVVDGMLAGKTVFIYAKDFDTYPKERGFAPHFFELPYKVNKSEAELFKCIKNYNAAAMEPKIKRFLDMVKPFDDGHASEAVVARIKAVIGHSAQVLPARSAVPSDLDAFEYVRAKYSAFRDALPVYKSEGSATPKIFWWCWLQGEENAPQLCKVCLKSLRRHYSDYEINVITLDNAEDYVSFPEHIVQKFNDGKITPTHLSDLLRLELLINYGGVWADSCVLCTGREKDYLQEPLFIFQSKWRESAHLGSSWFIVSEKGNPILKTARDLLYKYWQDHDALGEGGFYFVFHCMFRLAAEKYPDLWAKVPLYSNIPPHVLQMEFFNQYNPDRFEQIKHMSHFHKLTWKYYPEQLSPERTAGSNYAYIMNFLS